MCIRDSQHPAYVFLVQEARKAGLLPTFEPDVYIHDSSALESNSVSRPFVWFVGPHATHIVWCDRPLTNASALVADMVALVGPTILYWDGTDTRTITTYDAANVMAGRAWNDLG